MKYIYVVICIFFLSMISMPANSAEVKEDFGKKAKYQSVRQGVHGDKDVNQKATEVSFSIGATFPHVPGPITRAQKFTFGQPVSSATLLTNNSSHYCKGISITVADNDVYVVATFQAQWDTHVTADGTFLVSFKPVTFKSVDIDPDCNGKEWHKGTPLAAQRNHCDGLTTQGKCYTGQNCTGTLTASSTTCKNCRDYLQGMSFESLNTGHCYSTN
jgi:hypothetical protein